MKLVNANDVRSKDKIYSVISQPMPVYHSTEELEQNENNYEIVSSFDELLAFCRKKDVSLEWMGLTDDARYKNITEYNVFLKTVDKFIPDTADAGGVIFYMIDENKGFITTDACYIRCYYLLIRSNKIIMFTSAGVNSATITKWQPTAAVRTQFLFEYDPRKGMGSQAFYEKKLNNLLNRKKPTVDIYKFLFAFLNNQAPSFLDLDKSAAASFGSKIRKDDRYRILTSPQFQGAMMQVLKILMPGLQNEVRKQFPPEKVVGLLATASGIAKDKGNVKELLEIFDKVSEAGYAETQFTNDERLPQLPMIGNTKHANANMLEPTKEEEVDEEKMFDDLRKETDSLSSFVTLDAGENDEI